MMNMETFSQNILVELVLVLYSMNITACLCYLFFHGTDQLFILRPAVASFLLELLFQSLQLSRHGPLHLHRLNTHRQGRKHRRFTSVAKEVKIPTLWVRQTNINTVFENAQLERNPWRAAMPVLKPQWTEKLPLPSCPCLGASIPLTQQFGGPLSGPITTT